MNGIHDMGGMDGFGPIDVSDDARFHHDWEPHARAMAHLSWKRGFINLDQLRRGMEEMPPVDYLRTPYFGRWLHATERGLIERGFLSQAEIDERIRELQESTFDAGEVAAPVAWVAKPAAPDRDAIVHRFEVGDSVRVRNVHIPGHTRCPRYLRGKIGMIRRCYGHEILPDTNAHLQSDQPQVVYSVTFTAGEIWGESGDPRQLLSIDLWDSYLEPV
jgi:nitrile hydratase